MTEGSPSAAKVATDSHAATAEKDEGDQSTSAPDWDALLKSAPAAATVTAVDFVESLGSASNPQKIRCDKGRLYSVKFSSNAYGNGHATFLEQMIPRLGRLIGAPMPEVFLIDVTTDFLAVNTIVVAGNPAPPGLHHASLWADGYSDRAAIDHIDANRRALGALSVTYTWLACTGDQQLIYGDQKPHRVLSVDHSEFFAGQGQFTEATLTALPAPTVYDPWFDSVGLTDPDREDSLVALASVTPLQIAAAVAAPPDSWGVPPDERAAMAARIFERQGQVLGLGGKVRV